MDTHTTSHAADFSIATVPPTAPQRQLAVIVAATVLAATAIITAFGATQLQEIDSIVPVIEFVIFVSDFFTAALLSSHARIIGSHRLLVLACGYLFSALMVLSHALTFPGAFAPSGLLGAGLQTTGWLFIFRHLGFPLFLPPPPCDSLVLGGEFWSHLSNVDGCILRRRMVRRFSCVGKIHRKVSAVRNVLAAGAMPCVWMLVAVPLCVCVGDARAQTSPETPTSPATESPNSTLPEATPTQSGVIKLPPIVVRSGRPKTTAGREKPAQTAEQSIQAPPSPYDTGDPNVAGGAPVQSSAANQLTVSGAQVNAVPFSRPGEALEIVPGLIITQHSGEGKANQYFLRGYNLDHGTDLAITYDGVPINMPTHAHGQGYADLNMLIPELISSVNVRKGPYYADVGDFGSVGAVSINLRDTVPKNVAQLTSGSFGYERFLGYGSTPFSAGNLLYAAEAATYNGPWTNPDDMRKFNGLLRYSQGSNLNGLTVTGMAYSNKWNSTDQVPLRAITFGQLGLYDAFDPTDGGNANRFSLSARLAETDDKGAWLANAYAVKSKLDLYNNFTYFLTDPVNGDQFHQHDDRVLAGANASRTINGSLGSLPTETTFGVQSWYNNIDLSLSNTVARQFLSYTRSDHVNEGTVGIYAQNVLHWTPWLRTIVGLREDYYTANVKSFFDLQIPAMRMPQSRARNCRWFSAHSTRLNFMSARALDFIAMTRAA